MDKNEAALLYLLRDRSKMVDIPVKLVSSCLRFDKRQNLLASAQIGFFSRISHRLTRSDSHHVCQCMARLHFQVQVSSASSGKPLASGLYILCSLPVGSGIIRIVKNAFG